jgi:hypothetical protein
MKLLTLSLFVASNVLAVWFCFGGHPMLIAGAITFIFLAITIEMLDMRRER